jgi:hypothetical protein
MGMSDYLRNVGGGLSLMGLATILPSSHFYWWNVGAFYIGVLALAAEAMLENWSLRWRVGVCAVWLAFLVLFSWKVVWVSAPFEPMFTAGDGDYAVGSDVYGIKWESGVSDLSIAIPNPTSFNYEGLDISFKPDVPVREIAQVTSLADVSYQVIREARGMEIANMKFTAKDKNGRVVSSGSPTLYASADGFRMHCPDLPPNTILELFVALVNPKVGNQGLTMLNGGDPSSFGGERKKAGSVYIKGRFNVLNRPHLIEHTYAIKQ